MAEKLLTLGCDPELAIIGKAGIALPARNFLAGGTQGRVGTDASGIQAELRPGVALNAIDLAVRCRMALNELRELLAPYYTDGSIRKTIGGSFARMEVAIGGHVHIGGLTPNQIPSFTEWADHLGHIWWTKVESAKSINSRTALAYGRPSDVRNQPHGIEYRTLGSWMSSPKVAVAAISLIHLAAELALREIKPTSNSWIKEVKELREKELIPKTCRIGIDRAEELYGIGPINMKGDVIETWKLIKDSLPKQAIPADIED